MTPSGAGSTEGPDPARRPTCITPGCDRAAYVPKNPEVKMVHCSKCIERIAFGVR